jgi:adenylate cyclase
MGEDEAGTLSALRQMRTETLAPKVSGQRGKVVKNMGDGWLVEFASVADAVTCAIEVQEALARNESIKLRISVHLGDITHVDDDIYGDGVNIAARLQEIAEPGAIIISDIAQRSIDGKLATTFVDLGAHSLKNISEPVTAYGWGMKSVSAGASALTLPDKPSIAVLAFDNMSDDPEQEYFSDGISEDIIAELARYSDFLVIARNSSFVYKGHSLDLKRVASELGVRFVLEGSVRKAGNRVRVVAQLIDAISGGHIWAERFDRELDDIFAVQDEITGQIVSALGQSIQNFQLQESRRKEPASLGAYDKCLQAAAQLPNPDHAPFTDARRLAQEAIALDPSYAQAHAIVAWTQLISFTSRWPDDPGGTLEGAYENAQKAITLDDHNFLAYSVLGLCQIWQRRHDLGIASFENAIALNPNEATTRAYFSVSLVFAGEPEQALGQIETAMRLNPHYPATYRHFRGRAYFIQERYEEAELDFNQATAQAPRWPGGRLMLAATEAALGKLETAHSNVMAVLEISPDINLNNLATNWPFRSEAQFGHFAGLLRQAGLPD